MSKPIRARELTEAIDCLTSGPCPPAEAVQVMPLSEEGPDWKAALEFVGGDRQLLHELVELFLQECPNWLRELRRTLAEEDTMALRRLAHKLKGALGSFGAQAASAAAGQVEMQGREGDRVGVAKAGRVLELEIERLRLALAASMHP